MVHFQYLLKPLNAIIMVDYKQLGGFVEMLPTIILMTCVILDWIWIERLH